MYKQRACVGCGVLFIPNSPNNRYCTPACWNEDHNRKRHADEWPEGKCRSQRNGCLGIVTDINPRTGELYRYCNSCRKHHYAWQSQETSKSRVTALELYGSRCACCGITDSDVLDFHHINGDNDRSRMGLNLYRWIIKDNPNDLEILCSNCHRSKHVNGVCKLHHDEAK